MKIITGKDPLQDRALKRYNTIQSDCLLYKTKLKEAEGKTNKRRVF